MKIPDQLLSAVHDQLEESDPPVKVAALLHLARVLAAFDRENAERVLERGIALASELPEPGGRTLMTQAADLAATVSPRRALDLMASAADPFHHRADGVMLNMMRHGHQAEAVAYLGQPDPKERYPFRAAQEAIGRYRGDEDKQRMILRAAIEAWRGHSQSGANEFEGLFVGCWRVLFVAEATEVVREVVRRIESESDQKTRAGFSAGWKRVRFSSTRESRLFKLFGVLRKLDQELADSLRGKYAQLAKAVKVFPRGYGAEATTLPERCQPEKPVGRYEEPDLMTVHGRFRLLPMPKALKTDFKAPFKAALRLYSRDTDPANGNQAPKEYWPSTMEFRNILYKAGQNQGPDAAKHLDRIPDRDLRLFAQIEMIAAIAGLPQFGGMSSFRPRR